MLKAIVFDLDETLCKTNKGILQKNVRLLKKIEKSGIRIVISSGKPTYYLCGFFRQVGLKSPILIGENGAIIQFGIDLPPKVYYSLEYNKDAEKNIDFLKYEIKQNFKDIFWQPNTTGIAVFAKSKLEYNKLKNMLKNNQSKLANLNIYYHSNSIDILPKEINKFNSLKFLCEKLNIKRNEIIAVGDELNDYPMFEFVKISYGINIADSTKVSKVFKTINQALNFIIENNIN